MNLIRITENDLCEIIDNVLKTKLNEGTLKEAIPNDSMNGGVQPKQNLNGMPNKAPMPNMSKPSPMQNIDARRAIKLINDMRLNGEIDEASAQNVLNALNKKTITRPQPNDGFPNR